ncbi:MAG: trypsin-like peptidase domain-containing protein, partial [Bacillota bacterium]|nr:trypsin-like peptidase domain-containing protein [Bacillota bacterium]
GLTAAEFGDSDKLKVGQDVIAIGNPEGLDFQNSLTRGCVSAVNRSIELNSLVKYIQTDAAINPGNSGGPLLTLDGKVIGINTSKIVLQNFEGMGFAIPIDTAQSVINDLIKQGYVSGRVRLGITGQEVSSSNSATQGLPNGILIAGVTSDSPLSGTKVQKGDVLTAIDGTNVSTFQDVYAVLAKHSPGDKVQVKLYRPATNNPSQGQSYTITISLVADTGQTQQ